MLLFSIFLTRENLLLLEITEMESSISHCIYMTIRHTFHRLAFRPIPGKPCLSSIPPRPPVFTLLIGPLVCSSVSWQQVSWCSGESIPERHLYIRKVRNNFTVHRKDSTSQIYPMEPKQRSPQLKVLLARAYNCSETNFNAIQQPCR